MVLSLPVSQTLNQPLSEENSVQGCRSINSLLCLLVVIGQAGLISSQDLGLKRAPITLLLLVPGPVLRVRQAGPSWSPELRTSQSEG